METYAERLSWAIENSATEYSQSSLAREIKDRTGKRVTAQTIQHLCDPKKNSQGSVHTPVIAQILGINAMWLYNNYGSPHDGIRSESDGAKDYTHKKVKVEDGRWPFDVPYEDFSLVLSDKTEKSVKNTIEDIMRGAVSRVKEGKSKPTKSAKA